MSNLVKINYKPILISLIILCLLPLVPVVIEILFKLGTSFGTWIRLLGTNGICL